MNFKVFAIFAAFVLMAIASEAQGESNEDEFFSKWGKDSLNKHIIRFERKQQLIFLTFQLID